MILTVNGRVVDAPALPRTHLADHLRDSLDLTGTHLGCEQGACGACTVLLDDVPVRGCLVRAVECEGSTVRTIEGFDGDLLMTELRVAFSAHHALQCGYCTPGMLITARDIVLRLGQQPEARVREDLAGNLCRCTGYQGIVEAVMAVAAGRTPQPMVAPQRQAASIPPTVIQSTPIQSAPIQAASPRPSAASPMPAGAGGVTQAITIVAPPDAVFAALADPRRAASCLPGAEVTAWDGSRLEGRIRAALGPVKVAFAGEVEAASDPATRSGSLSGQGRDGGTGSGAQGQVNWRVAPDAQGSVVTVEISWRLSGALAGFARGGLVQDLVGRMAREFGANLSREMGGSPPLAADPPSLLAMLFAQLRAWISQRFNRHDGGSR